MEERGCQVSGVQLVYERAPDGRLSRELRSTRDLSPGDVLISVPLDCTLHFVNGGLAAGSDASSSGDSNSSSSSSDEAGRAALRRLQQGVPLASDSGRGAWQFKVALEVLYHVAQGPASPLAPYIATLPGLCPGIPGPQVAMLFPEELQQLQYAPLVADAGAQVYWWQQYSKDVLGQLPGSSDDAFRGKAISQQQLGWALSVAMSRAFGFKQLGGWALVPLVDMANHSPISNCEIRYRDQRVSMLANKQVSAGSPILLRYGSHSNSDLLLSYGFVLPDNPADRFRFPLDLDLLLAAIAQFVGGELPPTGRATDGLKQWQRTALAQLGLMPAQKAAGSSSSSDGPVGGAAAPAAASVAGEGSKTAEAQPEAGPLMVSVGGEPPVSPELLAAVRVVLATDRSSIKGRSLQQLGDWQQPLSTLHEAVVMKGLVGLCTVLYKSFPTSIQADKALLAELQQQQPPSTAAGMDSSSHQPQQGGEDSSLLAVERMAVAVQFRLQMKLLLERATKSLIVRLKELTAAS